jgi:Tfp pilus assembly protein PilO
MPRSQAERLWLLGGAIAALLLVLIGYFLLISPQRSQTSSTDAQVSSAQLQNSTLQSRIDTLQRQNKDLATYQSALKQAQLALPATSGLPAFLRTLQTIGSATQTTVAALSVNPPISLTPTTGATAPTPSSSAPTSASSTGTSAAAGPSIYALPITAQVIGSPAQLEAFLTQLQAVQPRAVLITDISQSSGATGSSPGATELQLTMQAFVAPDTADGQPIAPTTTP